VIGQPTRPAAGKIIPQGFGFAGSAEWVAKNIVHHFEKAEGQFAVRLDPVAEVTDEFP